jgi:hypothetical protein
MKGPVKRKKVPKKVVRAAKIEKHRRLIKRYSGKAKPGDFDHS